MFVLSDNEDKNTEADIAQEEGEVFDDNQSMGSVYFKNVVTKVNDKNSTQKNSSSRPVSR